MHRRCKASSNNEKGVGPWGIRGQVAKALADKNEVQDGTGDKSEVHKNSNSPEMMMAKLFLMIVLVNLQCCLVARTGDKAYG